MITNGFKDTVHIFQVSSIKDRNSGNIPQYKEDDIVYSVPCRIKKSSDPQKQIKIVFDNTQSIKTGDCVLSSVDKEMYYVESVRKASDRERLHHITAYVKIDNSKGNLEEKITDGQQ